MSPHGRAKFIAPLGLWYVHRSAHATPWELYGQAGEIPAEQQYMSKDLLDLFEAAREKLGQPLLISSGRRTQAMQDALRDAGYRAAKNSTHVLGLALDVYVPKKMKDFAFAEVFRDLGKELLGSIPRTGYIKYRKEKASSAFIHVDLGPWLFRHAHESYKQSLPPAWGIEGLIF